MLNINRPGKSGLLFKHQEQPEPLLLFSQFNIFTIQQVRSLMFALLLLCLSSFRVSERSAGADGHHICEECERERSGPPGGLVHR